MKDVECPYCGHEQEINHDDGYGYEEDTLHRQECSNCEKTFVYDTAIIFHHNAYKADCLNGDEHKWKQIQGAPRAYFVGKYRCQMCGEEQILDKEANRKSLEEYFKKIGNK